MPTLIAGAFIGETQTPYIWTCSGCDAIFSLERMRIPNPNELRKINANFQAHCRQAHQNEAVIGLAVPEVNEDASQAAARIVREATERE